jgi:hypothetical protein
VVRRGGESSLVASAGAALVGLLFVAVSIAPNRTVMRNAPLDRQVLAASTFTAMLNAFFISLVALVPGVNLGIITVIMGAIAFVNSVTLGWYFLQQQRDSSKRTGRLSALFLISRISVMRDLDEPVIDEEEAPGSASSTTTSAAVPQQPRPQP